MRQLTSEERRRIVEIRKTTARATTTLNGATALAIEEPVAPNGRVKRLLKTISAVALLGGGILAYRLLEFELAGSLVEAFLPRL